VINSSGVIAVVDNNNLVWVFQPGAQKDMFCTGMNVYVLL